MSGGQGDVASEIKKIREENAGMHAAILSTLSMAGRSDSYGMIKEFIALQAEVKQMKADREADKVAHKKVCDELEALKLKQTQDAAEIKKKQEAQDVQLQNHDYRFSIRLVDPVQSFIAGKWKLASSTGREEYEKLINADHYAQKISYDNRYFTYSGGSLSSYVGSNNNTPDPAFTKEYTVNNRKLIFGYGKGVYYSKIFQWINISIENSQLIVLATIYEKSDESKGIANCKCIYDSI